MCVFGRETNLDRVLHQVVRFPLRDLLEARTARLPNDDSAIRCADGDLFVSIVRHAIAVVLDIRSAPLVKTLLDCSCDC